MTCKYPGNSSEAQSDNEEGLVLTSGGSSPPQSQQHELEQQLTSMYIYNTMSMKLPNEKTIDEQIPRSFNRGSVRR